MKFEFYIEPNDTHRPPTPLPKVVKEGAKPRKPRKTKGRKIPTVTIGEVANFLEKRYEIYDKFWNNEEAMDAIQTHVEELFIQDLDECKSGCSTEELDLFLTKISAKIIGLLTDFWVKEKHGIPKTKASTLRGKPSFIDTGEVLNNTKGSFVINWNEVDA